MIEAGALPEQKGAVDLENMCEEFCHRLYSRQMRLLGPHRQPHISQYRQVRKQAPQAAIIVLTVFEDEDKIFRAICAGASGYLLKTAPVEEIARAIRDALAGGASMNGRIARRVLDMFARFAPTRGDYGLTPRETQILESMVKGKTKKEIAALLDLSFHTVDTHLRNIYQKLEVNTRTGAVAKALKEKLV